MQKPKGKIHSIVGCLAMVALLAPATGINAQSASESEKPAQEQQQAREEARPAAPARHAVPHVTGTVTRWTGNRIDLKTAEGKEQKVAVNNSTELLTEARVGAEVRVEFSRRVSGFIIAERVLPAQEAAPAAAQPAQDPAPGQSAKAVTGTVVSWNDTALLLRTEAGDVTLFLSPSTEYQVKSLDPGLQVMVEFEGTEQARVATRVLAPKKTERTDKEPAESKSDSE